MRKANLSDFNRGWLGGDYSLSLLLPSKYNPTLDGEVKFTFLNGDSTTCKANEVLVIAPSEVYSLESNIATVRDNFNNAG